MLDGRNIKQLSSLSYYVSMHAQTCVHLAIWTVISEVNPSLFARVCIFHAVFGIWV